ncbi:amino acid ABC transporter permease [Brenneria populi]|uniref:Amino acid ABC transporter permease n=1 Tax=Brenneria populi TaxID=1505588 RepID=A0ABU6JU66_9GAMM|nr:amino acid ABC transporter permease [Brenneria populi Li et al. 2015]
MGNQLDFAVLTQGEYPHWILQGVITTVELTALAWVISLVVGTLLALIRMSHSRVGKMLVACYVEFHQNVPMLVQIFLWYFGIPTLFPEEVQTWTNTHNSEFLFAFIAVGLCMGAYISEDLRAGIRTIPRSQIEASRALGLGYVQAFRLVVFPQAARVALPTLINHTVLLFKNTSLAMTVGVAELTYVAREIESQTFHTAEIYAVVTVLYLFVSLLIMYTGSVLEQRYRIKAR